MNRPKVKVFDWINVKSSEISDGVNGYVLNVRANGDLDVGYYQNNIKTVSDVVVWEGSYWKFKHSGPSGSYLQGFEAEIVKQGPPDLQE